MIEFYGRKYWDLKEAAHYLTIDEVTVLDYLVKEALVKYSGEAIPISKINNEDFQLEDVKWISGYFWFPIYENEYIESRDDYWVRDFLIPHYIKVKELLFSSNERCNPATEDWVPYRNSNLGEQVGFYSNMYFWVDTIKNFALEKGINVPITNNMLPTDVVISTELSPSETTSFSDQIIDENTALRKRVAELEQLLSEQKELPTQTKNKVMPIIYGLCCLYFNKGHPLKNKRANCDAIARELTTKFKVIIGDKGLENYYKDGMEILGHDE